MVEDADVEDEVVRREQLQPGDEVRLDAEVRVGLVLDQPADAAQRLEPAELFELSLDRLAPFQRQRGDHALEPRLGRGEPVDPGRLAEMLRKVDIDLDEDELVDLDRGGRAHQIGGQDLPVEYGLAIAKYGAVWAYR